MQRSKDLQRERDLLTSSNKPNNPESRPSSPVVDLGGLEKSMAFLGLTTPIPQPKPGGQSGPGVVNSSHPTHKDVPVCPLCISLSLFLYLCFSFSLCMYAITGMSKKVLIALITLITLITLVCVHTG